MVTSTVITDPQDWADESILLPHELIRSALNRMEHVLKEDNFGEYAIWKITYFQRWYKKYFCTFVEHHHTAEENIYFPFIKTKVEIPEKVETDHSELMNLMDDIKGIYDIDLLRNKVSILKEKMFEHLAEEEQIIPSALRDNFTKLQEKIIVNMIIQSLGLSGNKVALPWVLDNMSTWTTQSNIDEIYNGLPRFIKFMYNNFWLKDYKKNNIGLLDAILSNKQKKCFC